MAKASGFAPVNGTRLYYELAGEGDPLVLIHGFTLDRRMWDAQFESFARQYRVLRYDGPGFGKSDPPARDDYDRVADLKALLEAHGIEQAHLLGLSLGGAIAIDFALTYPESTRSLIAVDSALVGHLWSSEWTAELQAVRAKGRSGDVAGAKDMWLSTSLFGPTLENPSAAESLKVMVGAYSGWHWLHGPARPTNSHAAERLGELRMPVLSITGERDLGDFHAIAAALEMQANAKRVILPHVGHMSPVEDPQAFNRVVLDFLETCSSSPSDLDDDAVEGEPR
jgi:pimeloyl-ACP methyl ester carboxylesterase